MSCLSKHTAPIPSGSLMRGEAGGGGHRKWNQLLGWPETIPPQSPHADRDMRPEAAARPPPAPCLSSPHPPARAGLLSKAMAMTTSHAAAADRRPRASPSPGPGHQTDPPWGPACPTPRGDCRGLQAHLCQDPGVRLQPPPPVTARPHSFAGLDFWILSFAMRGFLSD